MVEAGLGIRVEMDAGSVDAASGSVAMAVVLSGLDLSSAGLAFSTMVPS